MNKNIIFDNNIVSYYQMPSLQIMSTYNANIKKSCHIYSHIINNVANILVKVLEHIFFLNVSGTYNIGNDKSDDIFIQIISECYEKSDNFHVSEETDNFHVSEETLWGVFEKITKYLDTYIKFNNLYNLLCRVIRNVLSSCTEIINNIENTHSKRILIYHSYISIKMCEYIATDYDISKLNYPILYNNYISFGCTYPDITSNIKDNITYTIIIDTQNFTETYYSITLQNWNNIKEIISHHLQLLSTNNLIKKHM